MLSLSHLSSEWVFFSAPLTLDVETQFYERRHPGTDCLALILTVTLKIRSQSIFYQQEAYLKYRSLTTGNFWVVVLIIWCWGRGKVPFKIFTCLGLYVHKGVGGGWEGSQNLIFLSAHYTCSTNGEVLTLDPNKTK